jgi:cell wall-associated NlpC family hydrolase
VNSRELLYDYAKSFLGLPYIWGGDDPVLGVDCSGLCVELLKSVGILAKGSDYTAAGLRNLFAASRLHVPEFGALAFYGASSITHVGFCLNDKLMIEAGGGGSKTLTAQDAAKQNAYVRIRPIMSRSDFAGVYMPKYPWLLGV